MSPADPDSGGGKTRVATSGGNDQQPRGMMMCTVVMQAVLRYGRRLLNGECAHFSRGMKDSPVIP